MAIFTEEYCIELMNTKKNNLNFINEAKWYFMPRFEKNPWLKEYQNDLKDANKILKLNKIKTKTEADKVFSICFRILNMLSNVGSMATLGFCVTGVGFIVHMVARTIDWGLQSASEHYMETNTDKLIKQLENLSKNEKDTKKKDAYNKAIDKMKKAQVKFKNRPKLKNSTENDEQGIGLIVY